MQGSSKQFASLLSLLAFSVLPTPHHNWDPASELEKVRWMDQSCNLLSSVRVSMAVMRPHDQSNLGKKGFILVIVSNNSSSSKPVRAGTQVDQKNSSGPEKLKGEAEAEAVESDVDWLAHMAGSASLLSNRAQDHHPRDGTTHSSLGPSPSINKKLPYRLAYGLN